LLTSLIASEIVDRIIVGSTGWSELFARHDFFQKYRYYLMVIASTENADLQLKWYAMSLDTTHFAAHCLSGRALSNLGYVNSS